MIGIIEPTYGQHDHAAVNAALVRAVALAFPDEKILFAASPMHRRYVESSCRLPPQVSTIDIAVPPPGGVSVRRLTAQWRAFRAVMGGVNKPRAVILLSSGPETFFASRLIAAEFGAVSLFIVLHGNLNDAVGRRSRDPRRRLFDYRSGLAAARHPRIKLIVLEEHIRTAAIRLQLAPAPSLLTWPLPLNEDEIEKSALRRAAGSPIRIAFIGAATHNKGFDKFLTLARALSNCSAKRRYEFRLIGAMIEEFPEAVHSNIPLSAQPLARDAFIRNLREIDYVILPFMVDTYALTASGSLLDCVSQQKPIISLDFPAVRNLTERFGRIGFVCDSMEEMQNLLLSCQDVSDAVVYANFCDRLATISASRTTVATAGVIRRDIGP